MSRIDEELSQGFHRAERPVATDDVLERVGDRRRRAASRRRLGTAALALVVVGGTIGGFALLERAFRPDGRVASQPSPANGPLVVSVWTPAPHRTAHLELVSADGSASRALTPPGNGYDQYPAASPDGRSVAYVSYGPDYESRVDAVLTVLDLTTGEKRGLATGEISSASWSPDGTTIAFLGTLRGETAIWIVPADGSGAPEPVVEDGSERIEGRSLWGPARWSPGGTALTFEVSNTPASDAPVRPPGVVTFDITNGEMTFLSPTDGNVAGDPAWSPDGSRIAFAKTGGIWSVSPTGGEPVLIVGVPSEEFHSEGYDRSAGTPTSPVWSPDGTNLAYVRATTSDGPALWVDALDGSDPVRIAPFGAGAAWLPYSDAVTFASSSASPVVQEEGTDIGLDTRLCNTGRLGGLNLLSGGDRDTAWTGYAVNDDGRCPINTDKQEWLVAVDVTGDGLADASTGLPQACIYTGCSPLDATDLDADGDQELIVMTLFSIIDHRYFSVRTTQAGGNAIVPILVAEPGHRQAGIEPGEPLVTAAAGDAGYSAWMRCEGYPDAPILVFTYVSSIVESEQPAEWHETKLQLQGDGMFHVVETNDFTLPPGDDPGLIRSEAPACGVDFYYWGSN